MSWWGKVVGGAFGFMLGGALGAVLGTALGHSLDRGLDSLPDEQLPPPPPGDRDRVQMAFFTATFSVMGHLAKADGRVSEDEIAMARAVMDQMELNGAMRRAAIDLFTAGKRADFQLDEVLEQFRLECHRRQTLIQMFIEIQLQAAWADGVFDVAEQRLLHHICQQLHFPLSAFEQLAQRQRAEREAGFSGKRATASRSQGLTLDQAYQLLNVTPDATDQAVKRAYRRLMSQHHPDKLVARGLPEEMMKLAAQKTHEIRSAYERIKQARGF